MMDVKNAHKCVLKPWSGRGSGASLISINASQFCVFLTCLKREKEYFCVFKVIQTLGSSEHEKYFTDY